MGGKAWQGHPPKPTAGRSQLRHGSAIQDSPRKAVKPDEPRQMSPSARSLTLSKTSPGSVWAAWQGSTSPSGEMAQLSAQSGTMSLP